MAKIIGGLGTSHVPSIAVAIDKGLADTADWKPFFDGYIPARAWMADKKPDIAVVIFNDHGNAFFLDQVPTLAVGVADSYRPIDEGWGPRAVPDFPGAPEFSWHLVDTMVENHFDPLVCRELEVDHGMQVPMELFFGRPEAWPARVVPILVNTIQFPIPTPQRMWDLGLVLRKAIASWDTEETVAILGTGGLSHQLQGSRAGFINPEADRAWIAEIGDNPEKYRNMTREDYVEVFGSEGAELIMWLVMRGAMDEKVHTVHSHYYSPASMTGAGMVVLENSEA
ncbi:class III extradiol dioxygenase family protein [Puniceibacterium sp. IMCC21224]|uniref:class III extradiol dioxygenase family protein n=1 Tax=Puniceibacterium sp. IMCC21224 TaxID=1618204 RepID=UPI00064D7C19|nr:class III extradiol dioxygenase family protein [Puniceibacterium sp. IMCC21224]KMK66171.1 Catalytic LigB subunit of aromatic ring-opening dioxygenase [Puniceibacterium sp. IMCC21224]